jgi:hypothetical protein
MQYMPLVALLLLRLRTWGGWLTYLFTGDAGPLRRREAVPFWTRNCFSHKHVPVVLCADQELRAVLWMWKHAGPSAASVHTPL